MSDFVAPIFWTVLTVLAAPVLVYLCVKLGRTAYLKANKQHEQDNQHHLRNGQQPQPRKRVKDGSESS